MFNDTRKVVHVYVDASLSGMGACWDENVYAVSRHLAATWNLSITQSEMLNVLVALRTFGHFWTKSRVKLHIDNTAVVFALRNGRIRDTFMQSVAKSIWLLAAIRDIQLEFSQC